MIVVITAEAEADLERIGDKIAEISPARAKNFLRELRQCSDGLTDMPERFSLVPHYEHTGVRRRPYGNYLIFYRVGIETIDILHVLHGAMDYEHLLFPKG